MGEKGTVQGLQFLYWRLASFFLENCEEITIETWTNYLQYEQLEKVALNIHTTN